MAEGIRADLIAANNVLAHTPHLNSFVAGLGRAPGRPRAWRPSSFRTSCELIDNNQFDTIYHEHF